MVLVRRARLQRGPLRQTARQRETTAASWALSSTATVVSPPTGARKASATATRPASPLSEAGEITATMWPAATAATVVPHPLWRQPSLSRPPPSRLRPNLLRPPPLPPRRPSGAPRTPHRGQAPPGAVLGSLHNLLEGSHAPARDSSPCPPCYSRCLPCSSWPLWAYPRHCKQRYPSDQGRLLSLPLLGHPRGPSTQEGLLPCSRAPLSVGLYGSRPHCNQAQPRRRSPFCPRAIKTLESDDGSVQGSEWEGASERGFDEPPADQQLWSFAASLVQLGDYAPSALVAGGETSESQAPCLTAAELALGAAAQPSTSPPSRRESAMVAAAVRRIQELVSY